MAVLTTQTPSARPGLAAPMLLLANGALLAFTIIVARIAAAHGAPMLWFLTWVMAGGGTILLIAAVILGRTGTDWPRRLLYGVGAGSFQAATMAMAFLSVAYVGAGYVSLVFAFPLLLTYVLALAVRMERYGHIRSLGVAVALTGGLMITAAKFDGLAAGDQYVGWVLVASAIPFVVAAGNLYRTRFWPGDAPPVLLAALMLLFAAAITGPVAAASEGWSAIWRPWEQSALITLTLLNIAAFALKFVVYFMLQKTAGPVYLSQIGSVSAAIGIPVAVFALGETVPDGFVLAVILIVAGAALFQVSASPR